jgi:hypothetical protein
MDTALRFAAIAASVVVMLGFALFAVDEMDRGSKNQQAALADQLNKPEASVVAPSPTPEEEAVREKQHSSAREVIDDANDVLLTPFSDVVNSDNNWATRGVPALLALLVYGLGLGLLANFLPKHRAHGDDWRAA